MPPMLYYFLGIITFFITLAKKNFLYRWEKLSINQLINVTDSTEFL